ncbi:MAG: Glyoxalase/bleomycin resistance protein/dioxygenase [Frankiales bacterium]|jgi:predicted enzyme related to lactoylglutathione lyase|nr:Glyoxalase/bleomycin resistance protein/dioxygenase [Frankiales bacterium]
MTNKTSYLPGEPIWIDLGTPDLDASIAFYSGLFGWTAEKGPAEFGGYTNFSKDGRKVAGLMPLMQEGQPPVWTSYVCTDDADKTTALVGENGGTVHAPPMDVGTLGRMAIYSAPDGAFFGAWQPGDHIGAETVSEEGTFAWTELSSRDQAKAKPFYSSVFGWEPKVQEGYTEFQLGETSVAGCMDMPEMVPAEVPSYWMPYFAASDPEAKAKQAAGLGGTVLVPIMDFPGGRFSVVQDPHGSTFGLLDLKT